MTSKTRIHSRLRAAESLLAGALFGMLSLLVVTSSTQPLPAHAAAGDGITAYVSPPLVQGPPSTFGTSLETFESWTSCSSFPASALGTFSGTCNRVTNGLAYVWGGASSTSDLPYVGGTPSQFVVASGTQLTLTFANPAKYVGFWWSAGSTNNIVKLYTADSGANPAATFTTTTINSILGASIPSPYPGTATVSAIDGSPYKKGYYFGRPSDHTSLTPTSFSGQNNQSHAYLNIFASGSIAFTKIEFSGQNFEFDNVAVSTTPTTPTQNLVFIESVLGKTATFLANGGTGAMAAQTETSSANLAANSYTRPGYTFAGWHTTSSGAGGTSYANQASFNFASDITLYAQWTISPLTVTYNTQGGSAISSGTTTIGTSVSTSPGTPIRDGYTFAGWFIDPTGGTSLTFPYTHARTTDFTLYAQWTPIPVVTTTTTTTLPIATATMPTTSPTLDAPRTAVAGQPISVMARGFTPGEKVILRVGDNRTITLTANSKGEVRLEFVLDSAESGKREVIASAATGGRIVRREIRVTAPQSLPVTGTNSASLAISAFFVSLLGFALLRRSRIFRT